MAESAPRFSVILPTHNEGELLAMTVEDILATTEYGSFEIVIVDDGSTDGSCDPFAARPGCRVIRASGLGVAGARNLGADHARGELLVFLDAHCLVSANWLARFDAVLADPEVGVAGPCFTKLRESYPKAAGMTWIDHTLQTAWGYPLTPDRPYEVPFVPGGCQAYRAELFREIGGYERGFTRWGFEDIEISLRLWLLGYRVVVDPAIVIGHYFRTEAAYDVKQRDLAFNLLRMIHLHFGPKRIRTVMQAIGGTPELDGILDDLYRTDVMEKRTALARKRAHSDDWFFQTFVPRLA
jgi:glycosyltransferase involved in cell wall biosynthesis